MLLAKSLLMRAFRIIALQRLDGLLEIHAFDVQIDAIFHP